MRLEQTQRPGPRAKAPSPFCTLAAAKSTAADRVTLPELSINASEDSMRKPYRKISKHCSITRSVVITLIGLALAAPAFAQTNSPWENVVNVLQQAFTSTIARELSLVAIVVSGLTFAFGEGGSPSLTFSRAQPI
jgi:type IV secretory pathway VirB2 component (pilin)